MQATGIAPTLQRALEDWSNVAPRLNALSDALNAGSARRRLRRWTWPQLAAPLPRAYEFVDGSAYLPHVERVRRARGAEVPESFYTDPLMYQATSAGFLGPRDPVRVVDEGYGIDLEAEIVVITDDVPMAVTPEQAACAHPADRPGQRRLAAQPDPGRTGEGLRLPAVEAALGACRRCS